MTAAYTTGKIIGRVIGATQYGLTKIGRGVVEGAVSLVDGIHTGKKRAGKPDSQTTTSSHKRKTTKGMKKSPKAKAKTKTTAKAGTKNKPPAKRGVTG